MSGADQERTGIEMPVVLTQGSQVNSDHPSEQRHMKHARGTASGGHSPTCWCPEILLGVCHTHKTSHPHVAVI